LDAICGVVDNLSLGARAFGGAMQHSSSILWQLIVLIGKGFEDGSNHIKPNLHIMAMIPIINFKQHVHKFLDINLYKLPLSSPSSSSS